MPSPSPISDAPDYLPRRRSFIKHPAGEWHWDGAKDEEGALQIVGYGPVARCFQAWVLLDQGTLIAHCGATAVALSHLTGASSALQVLALSFPLILLGVCGA